MSPEIPAVWLIVIDVLAWLLIHLGVAWGGTQLDVRHFRPRDWLYRERRWELGGRLYEKAFAVRKWKDWLPDGAALFKRGFRKGGLKATDRVYLEQFSKETCRGEAVHWVVSACSSLFFLWNPWWVGLIMIGYAIAANGPCILVQRYNRIRLERAQSRNGRTPSNLHT